MRIRVHLYPPPVHFNQPDALATSLCDGDEISFLLALAGG
jgi:hypothetical protein